MEQLTRQTNPSGSPLVESIEHGNVSHQAEGLVCLGLIGLQIEFLESRNEKMLEYVNNKIKEFNEENK
jgi:hypothetical protein